MEFKIETYHRNTSKEELINDVKRVAKELNKQTVTISEYETKGKYHPSTLTRNLVLGIPYWKWQIYKIAEAV
jgi:hypothetical protein